jgi:hypothetical protein
MRGFKQWLNELTEPFPTKPIDKNPYVNGKWSTSAFVTGRAKPRKNVVADAELEKKKEGGEDGYHL